MLSRLRSIATCRQHHPISYDIRSRNECSNSQYLIRAQIYEDTTAHAEGLDDCEYALLIVRLLLRGQPRGEEVGTSRHGPSARPIGAFQRLRSCR